jgi:hypothetical protein
MARWGVTLPTSDFLFGAGATFIPFVVAWWRTRSNRELRAQKLYDRIMAQVHAENADLRAKVDECERRDARVMLFEICFRMLVAEMIKLDPSNAVLVQVKLLLEVGPIPPQSAEFAELLGQINGRAHDAVDRPS